METPQGFCSFCGKHLVMGEILYTPDARMACAPCNASRELVAADVQVGGSILRRAVFAVAAAPLSFVVSLFPSVIFMLLGLIIAGAAIAAGVTALLAINRKGDQRFTRHAEKDRGAIYTCSIIGIVIGALVAILLTVGLISYLTRSKKDLEYEYRDELEEFRTR